MASSSEFEGLPTAVLLEAPLTFEVPGGSVHCPMVLVKVNGVATKLILDTGSTDHVLTMDLAAKARFDSVPSDPGTDHTGDPVPSWSLGEISVDFGPVQIPLHKVIGIEGPPAFEPWGIGGFLSPQRLHRSATVVIDLVGYRITLIECTDDFLRGWLKDRHPALQPIVVRREQGEAVRILTSIEPFHGLVAMLNTGTSDTEFAGSALPGLEGVRADTTGRGLSGSEVTGAYVKDQLLQVDETRLSVPALFLRDQMPPEHPDGQIGMDLLRGTVLAISPQQDRPIHWMVPTASKL